MERQHVVPPAIAALASHGTLFYLYHRVTPVFQVHVMHLIFLMLIRQPIENVISTYFFILFLTGFAWRA